MTQELEKKIDPKYQGMIETVRKTIFPGADDAELALFFHRCAVAGCNPLDQLIHPMKFNDNESGGKKVVFITSINFLRSKSDETGTYDGMGEPEYEGEDAIMNGTESITVPSICRVKVYRKNIERPFVGVARWREYYPGEKKGHQWRIRPYHMLAKCAEALARRQAWPEKLNQLYTAEEMESATAQIAGVTRTGSTKPAVNPDDVRPSSPETTEQNLPVGTITAVFQKPGKKANGQPYVRYSVVINEQSFSTFEKTLAELAKSLKNQQVVYETEIKGEFKNLVSIKKYEAPKQESPQNPPKQPETAQESTQGEGGHVPTVESSEAFASTVTLFGAQKGLDEARLNGILDAEFGCSIDTVPAELQEKVVEHLKSL